MGLQGVIEWFKDGLAALGCLGDLELASEWIGRSDGRS